jgi:alanyl-tRNA synthetase
MTTKLYWADSHLTRFTAQVTESFVRDGRHVVVLDQTAFYPCGGGQPSDTGALGSTRVVDVSEADDGRILHHLESDHSFAVGDRVEGEVDWAHRREIMQQHTGQHILSQAFFQLFGAETRGFRITDRGAEIDLTLEAHPDEIAKAIARAEELANLVVFDDREIRTHTVTPEEAARLPLRKESFITDCIRVIEIADFDWSPCGGTHAKRTGEVGLIAVRGWERAKRMTRVQFVCGIRALQDYRAANQTAEGVAQRFSVARDEAVEAVARLFDEHRRLERRARALSELAAKAEAEEALAATAPRQGMRIVSRIFDDRDLEEIKLLAHRLVASDSVVALLAARDQETVRLVFARSADVEIDVSLLLRQACAALDGRGGGKPDFAQGGGSRVAALERALAEVKAELANGK